MQEINQINIKIPIRYKVNVIILGLWDKKHDPNGTMFLVNV